ncbi:hypothetical protein CHUAL_014138 [Chamberlinius hualienensis]
MIERSEIILWRRRYLRSIRTYRELGAKIYYFDEMWVNASYTLSKVSQDTTVKRAKGACVKGLSTGLKPPAGKDECLILVHAGSESGFVSGAALYFRSKKMSDYHEEMNGPRFLKWFKEQFLPNIEPNSIIVMDNAPYHSVLVENVPTTLTRKTDIRDWLTAKQVLWKPDMIKVELLALVNSVKHKYAKYQIDDIAEAAGHTVLRLPPYHCDLNPIEMVWSQVKGFIGYNSAKFKLADVENQIEKALEDITPKMWADCVGRVMKIEEQYWRLDNTAEEMAERIIINPCNYSDDDDKDSDGEMLICEIGE